MAGSCDPRRSTRCLPSSRTPTRALSRRAMGSSPIPSRSPAAPDPASPEAMIQRGSSADIAVLVELMAEFYAESGYPLDRDWAAASFGRLLGDGDRGAAWIAQACGEPAGHVVLVLRHSMEF